MDGTGIGLTRRNVLAATGATLVGAVGASRGLSQPVSYDQTTVVESKKLDLRVGWKEWYNGQVLDHRDTLADRTSTSQPVIQLDDVAPGDSGKLAIGLTTEADRGAPPPARLLTRVRALPGSGKENGMTEPETVAGDESRDRGELQDALDVHLWYDVGFTVGEVPLYGRCDGKFGSDVDTELDAGPFAVVSVPPASDAWMEIDAYPNRSNDCLRKDDSLCVGLEWNLPTDAGNRLQTDTIAFAVEFRAVQCQKGTGGTQ